MVILKREDMMMVVLRSILGFGKEKGVFVYL
jgi:hypothetical protein